MRSRTWRRGTARGRRRAGEIAQLGHDPFDLHGRLGGLRNPSGGQRAGSGGLPAVLARRLNPKPICWACSTCTRPATIRKRSWTSLKRSSRWKRRSREPWRRFSRRTRRLKIASCRRRRTFRNMLKAKPEYVVTTSEFNDVKNRLAMLHNRRKVDQKDDGRPKLRRAPGSGNSGDGSSGSGSGDDDRPTLKRRPDSGSGSDNPNN